MTGAMRRMGVYLGLVEDDDYADDFSQPTHSGSAHPSAERSPARRDSHADARHADARHPDTHPAETRYAEATYVDEHETSHVGYAEEYSQPQYQITAVHPRTYNEARTIGEHFRRDTPVIMNLTDMEDADAKRLVDFAAGLTFGLHGRIERVTNKVFLLSPAHVSVTAQERQRMVETGFFNQS
jgi:cell division inhibitor SepF